MASPEESGMEEESRDPDSSDQHRTATDQSDQENTWDNQQNTPIFDAASIPGTLGQDTLKLRLREAKKIFVETKTFSHALRILNQYHCVTICGASGEGKTTMSLMLAREYIRKGYQPVFVNNIDRFDVSECFRSSLEIVIILDDIFETVGSHTDILHLRNILDSVKTHLQNSKKKVSKHDTVKTHRAMQQSKATMKENDQGKTHKPEKQQSVRIVFTSKTYNFQEGISCLKYQKLSLFTCQTVIDLTTNKEFSYTNETKVAIFEHHRTLNPSVSVQDITKEDLLGLDETLFGFPQTCKLFFEFPTFKSNAKNNTKDFFKRPLFYLRMELSSIMALDNNQTAALILMLLCEDKLDLSQLELQGQDKTMDDRFKLVTDIVPSVTRSGIATAARRFRGTYFSGGDTMQFANISIHDACACVMYEKNPSFVLKYCSYEFLNGRLKSRTADKTEASDHLHFIFVSEEYHDLIAIRLAVGIEKGYFANTLTQSILKNKHVAQLLLQMLQTHRKESEQLPSKNAKRKKKKKIQESKPSWVHMKDKEKCFLYWAAIGDNSQLISEMQVNLNITFTQAEIQEALNGCAERNHLEMLSFLLQKINIRSESLIKSRLLLLSAENASWGVTEYLLKDCSIFNLTNQKKQNLLHLVCEKGEARILRTILETNQNLLSERNSFDEDNRNPIMLAVKTGSMKCFQLLSKETDCTVKDKYGYGLIHLACAGGNPNIIKYLLTLKTINSSGGDVLVSFDINSRGRNGRTPIMIAVAEGQQEVFDLLVLHNADLTLVDDYGDSLLDLACQGGNTKIVRHLLRSFNINSRGRFGWTSIMKAVVEGQQGVFDVLLSHKADLTLVDDYGDSLFHLACQGGNTEIVRQLLHPQMPFNINSKGRYDWTPIMRAAFNGHQRVFNMLLSNKADLGLEDEYGDSTLHLACQGGNTEIIKEVLPVSSINSRGKNDWTPIMFAAYGGHKNVIDILVENQADLQLVDDNGRDFITVAHDHGKRPDVVEHLQTLPRNKNTESCM